MSGSGGSGRGFGWGGKRRADDRDRDDREDRDRQAPGNRASRRATEQGVTATDPAQTPPRGSEENAEAVAPRSGELPARNGAAPKGENKTLPQSEQGGAKVDSPGKKSEGPPDAFERDQNVTQAENPSGLPKAPHNATELAGSGPDKELEELQPDTATDPLAEGVSVALDACTHAFFAGIKAPGPAGGSEMSAEMKGELETWVRNVGDHTSDPEKFVAGSFGRHLPAWQELLKDSKRESSKRVLKMLAAGIKPQFVGTEEAEPKKREQVRAMLARTVKPLEVDDLLHGQVPHQVEFRNHQSFYDNAPFAVGEAVKMVQNGTLHVYGPGDGKPKVVNPLGVVNLPKGRLVVNARYVNLFSKKHAFKYETLREVLTFLTQASFFTTWDFKAGYYHVLINPAYRKYFGIKIGEVYMHYNAMCFGWSAACFLYTLLTQELSKEIRLRAVPVSSYLDDGLTGDIDFYRCLWATIFIIKLLTLCGAVLSIPKCNLWPQQEGPWLGFIIETVAQRFAVAPAKMEKLRAALRGLAESADVTPRELAKVAGKVISVSPAVLPASLYSRPFFAAIQGKLTWDDVFSTPQAAKRTTELFLQRLPEWNGRRWFPRCITAEAGSDASETGFGGTIQIPGGEKLSVVGTLSEDERKMSSTARETVAFLRVLTEAHERAGEVLRGAAVLLKGDNQGAVRAVNAMNSRAPDVNAALRQLFELCVGGDFDVVRRIKGEFGVEPALDLFASDTWHLSDRFFSQHITPGCIAADALRVDWRDVLAPGEIAWIFPPVRLLSEVVTAIQRFETSCVVIVPEAPATNWWLALSGINKRASVRGPVILPHSTDTCTPSHRVPKGTANPALYKLQAFLITW
ncbi:Reverse transcriptase [Klebsormidium nitens]|uniref:Reverse transcriptase n=1 Tax=Klebsormidium nitens TaxID=105231 RepID=A0A1Y1ILB1_KLENI|nr:Reverse transcriptase [Klebsormidium nitens]|eukprot:GAQ91453.1 Reverse transcriptase [Klebsormidium nitens]